ncbi:MAG: 7-cyano-7-deazaguanine synthase QueC [Planctomycetota bacterium]|jgi:7-cyano-7-deazaguanine synthase|nr:7-cyano-7-deazaguanine synthase QueC [Planctomycetota bacterium]
MAKPDAVVLLSGGLDSATALAVAVRDGHACHCLSFDYGQRNIAELAAAAKVAAAGGARSHRCLRLDLRAIGGSALTDDIAVPKNQDNPGIPVTYVPARNTIFLAYGLAVAESLAAGAIFIGVNSVDFSGYPDCRPEFIAAFQGLADLATRQTSQGERIMIYAPLQKLDKAGIIQLGTELGVDYSLTLSCYDPDPDGLACGGCDACRFRRGGFQAAGLPDPTRYQANTRKGS